MSDDQKDRYSKFLAKFQRDFPGADETDGYVSIPKALFTKETGLTGNQLLVIIGLAIHDFHRDGKSFPGTRSLATLLGMSRSTVADALKVLDPDVPTKDGGKKTVTVARTKRATPKGDSFRYDIPSAWKQFGKDIPRKEGIFRKSALTPEELVVLKEKELADAKAKAGIPTVQPTPTVLNPTAPTIPTTPPQIQPTIQSLSRHYDSIEEAIEALDKMAELTRIAELAKQAAQAAQAPQEPSQEALPEAHAPELDILRDEYTRAGFGLNDHDLEKELQRADNNVTRALWALIDTQAEKVKRDIGYSLDWSRRDQPGSPDAMKQAKSIPDAEILAAIRKGMADPDNHDVTSKVRAEFLRRLAGQPANPVSTPESNPLKDLLDLAEATEVEPFDDDSDSNSEPEGEREARRVGI